VFVDKGVSFLFGTPPGLEVAEADADDPANQALRETLDLNRFPSLVKQFAVNGAVAGHAFFRLYQETEGRVRVLNLDPANVWPTWSPDDYLDVHKWRIQWTAVDSDGKLKAFRTIMERADDRRSWQITDQKSGDEQGQNWLNLREDVWPFPFSPVVDCQNLPVPNEYFGEPDLTKDIIDLNYRLEALASNMGKIVRLFAHPRPWAKGIAPKELDDIAPDQTAYLPPNGELGALQFQADLGSSIDLYERLRQALHELARIPEIATGKLENVGTLSGVALRILFQPVIEKTSDKRGTYGHALDELGRRIVALKRAGDYEDLTVAVTWPEMIPTDPLEERQAALLDQQLGVSQRTILERLGFDPESEKQNREDEGADLGETLLGTFDRGGPAPTGE
jgi:hypothetical protein